MKIFHLVLGSIIFLFLFSVETHAITESEAKLILIKDAYLNSMVNPESFENYLEIYRKDQSGGILSCAKSFREKMIEAGHRLDQTCEHLGQGEFYQNCVTKNPPDELKRWADSFINSLEKDYILLEAGYEPYVHWIDTTAGKSALVIKQSMGAKIHRAMVLIVYNKFYIHFIEAFPCDFN